MYDVTDDRTCYNVQHWLNTVNEVNFVNLLFNFFLVFPLPSGGYVSLSHCNSLVHFVGIP